MQFLRPHGHPGFVQREEAADAVIEGPEALVPDLDAADFFLGQLDLAQVILGAGEGVAVDLQGLFVGEILAQVERLDAIGPAVRRAEALGVSGGVAGHRGGLA